MKLYPSIEEVFDQPKDFYKTIFFPLLTINLDSINKGEGKVHFLTVFGNGNPELEYKNDLFTFNSIRFDWTGDKYLFNGDLSTIESFNQLEKWYLEAEKEYQEHKLDYLTKKTYYEVKNSYLNQQNERRENISFDYYHYVQGVINYWITRDKYFETGRFIQGGAYTDDENDEVRKVYDKLSTTGMTSRSNELVGKVTGYNYSGFGEDEIILYIDRKKEQVFQKFNWS
jgi:hypothetical protein